MAEGGEKGEWKLTDERVGNPGEEKKGSTCAVVPQRKGEKVGKGPEGLNRARVLA